MKVNDHVNHNDLDQYIKSFAKSIRSFDEINSEILMVKFQNEWIVYFYSKDRLVSFERS